MHFNGFFHGRTSVNQTSYNVSVYSNTCAKKMISFETTALKTDSLVKTLHNPFIKKVSDEHDKICYLKK